MGQVRPDRGAGAGAPLRAETLKRILVAVPLLLLAPILVLYAVVALAIGDLLSTLRRPAKFGPDTSPDATAATIVIPNWNGRDLLSKYLPSVVDAVKNHPGSEILVVDNGSEDESVAFLRERFPSVRVLALPNNLGFGGGSNAGFRAATNDVVVLLNSDMRVEPGFLAPLLEGFADEKVFAVSCQIFFSDETKLREETGLTEGWWDTGALRVRHRIDGAVTDLFPCFYGGGGSCAFDRRKFLELGGFDELLRPFYLEDTDLGYMAWKRGWKVLYQPRGIVFHEHRGTIGRKFTASEIDTVLKKNFLLWTWKNIHEWDRLEEHVFYTLAGVMLSTVFGRSPERPHFGALWRAVSQIPGALRSRARARALARISDTEAFRIPLGGFFRDRFDGIPTDPERLRVLFVSPYPICPPIHGGGVFMLQTATGLTELCDLHLVILVDHEYEKPPHADLERKAKSTEYILRLQGKAKELGSIEPFAVREFASADLRWLLHRQIFIQKIDVLQLEYTAMAQYGEPYRRIATCLFEHDVYFQSIGRGLRQTQNKLRRVKASFEYLRSLRFELNAVRRFDRVQVCSRDNADYLRSFVPELNGRLDADLRAGIATAEYPLTIDGREPRTMLFLGSFRHPPNQEALEWFTRQVLPLVLTRCTDARLVIVGSDPPPAHSLPDLPGAVELRGFVADIREPLARYAAFVCPILSGSGVRVKVLEAFASGIPVVSTTLGAEGLASVDGDVCALADDPPGFADRIVQMFNDPAASAAMALRARRFVETEKNMSVLTPRLETSYRETVRRKRS